MVDVAEPSERATWTSTLIGVGGSLLIHAAVYALISWVGTMPTLDFELQIPSEVEFGLTEAMQTRAPAPTLPSTPPSAPEPVTTPLETADVGDKPKPEKKPKPERKPKPDAGAEHAQLADAGTKDATPLSEGDALAGFAPQGTQLSLRIHMQRIRESDLVEDVRQLLAQIPDWRLILEGAQIDPIADLDRLFLASPDLRREKLVIAGQHNGDVDRVRAAVANMALARGKEATWTQHGAIEVAPWHNEDVTERVIALVGPQQFVICRPVDLQRVLAVAQGLAERAKQQGQDKSAGDALLGMSDEAVWSLSVEGARQFVPQRVTAVPTRLQVDVRPIAERKMIEVIAAATFDDAAQASEGKRYWDSVRNRFGSSPLVALMGMSSPLMNARLEANEATLDARTELNLQQVRMLLGFLRNALTPPPPPPPLPSAPTSAPTQPAATSPSTPAVTPPSPAPALPAASTVTP